MSTIMTASQRLALSKWAQSQDNTTPTIPRAAEWVKEQFGKDIPEDTIRTVLNRADLANGFHAYVSRALAKPSLRRIDSLTIKRTTANSGL